MGARCKPASTPAGLQILIAAAGQTVWCADADGTVRDGASWTRFAGQVLTGQVRDAWLDRVHDADRARARATWSAALQGGLPYEIECRLRHADGDWRWVLVRGQPLHDDEGRARDWIATLIDISPLKRAQAALRAASERKDEFLALLAHELRNPLAPLRNLADLARARGGALTAAELDIADRQLAQMTRLVDDLLDASRIGRGQMHLQRERCALHTILAASIDSTRALIERRGHRLRVEKVDSRLRLHADPARLQQVFANLLNNAAKYTPDGGVIDVRIEARANAVGVSIRDNGIGLHADTQQRIFAMFGQVRTDSQRGGGLGIGLALSRRLVALHGGDIQVSSEGPGRGACFTVWLPLDRSTARVVPAGPDANGMPRVGVVLLVDDDRDMVDSLAVLLSRHADAVHVAYGGADAQQLARRVRPQLVITDFDMPVVNGADLARALRADAATAGAVIVMLSGWADEDSRRRRAAAPVDLQLVKPVRADELVAAAAALLRERAPR